MYVTCPGCATRYTLPDHLLGSAGARVCCPSCWLTFVLGPDGGLAAVLGQAQPEPLAAPAEANGAPPDRPADAQSPLERAVAGALRRLDDPPGTLARAAAEGCLFAEHGPALLDAFDALGGAGAGEPLATAFRAALLEIAGVDLGPPAPREGEPAPR